jgi:hypothetical protein
LHATANLGSQAVNPVKVVKAVNLVKVPNLVKPVKVVNPVKAVKPAKVVNPVKAVKPAREAEDNRGRSAPTQEPATPVRLRRPGKVPIRPIPSARLIRV